jgi:hypothetical protein
MKALIVEVDPAGVAAGQDPAHGPVVEVEEPEGALVTGLPLTLGGPE